ncbi:hypothetical protein [Sphingorhabdus sp. YGSMI21]|uniref:hypothetical protein n=1 Tax=Sphingorhabdus sp. YGSMI21 TaxID=2077182 RepID=UPI000F4DC63C|nr:hypothetical protein [Sphingorhabdus sp. YGSMI21]
MTSTTEITRNAAFLAHRYDENSDAFQFVELTREQHRRCTFLTDEYIPEQSGRTMVRSQDVDLDKGALAPVYFIFHSAFACSTMMARALDIEGVSMGLKEPIVLNDLVGLKRRGAAPARLSAALEQSIALLSRPFSTDEKIIVKPSNIVNSLAPSILEMRPAAKALFLHAPLKSYLRSLAAKNMWGRIWARENAIGILEDGDLIGGFTSADLLRLTDIQVAAVAWLSEHARFAKMIERFGADRIKSLDSDKFLNNKHDTIARLSTFFGLALDKDQIENLLAGPAFTQHSKDFSKFDSTARLDRHSNVDDSNGEEIDMVVQWSAAVAESQNIPLELSAPLL